MITPNTIKPFTISPQTKTVENHQTNPIANKVSQAWQATSTQVKQPISQKTDYIDLTDAETTDIIEFLSKLKIVEHLDKQNPIDRQANFLALYKKIHNSTSEEKQRFIAGAMQMLKTPDSFANQASLKKIFEHSLYRISAIDLMSQPLIDQMRNHINSIKLEGDDDEEELVFE